MRENNHSAQDHEQARKILRVIFFLTIVGVGFTTFFCQRSFIWPLGICAGVDMLTHTSGLAEFLEKQSFRFIYILRLALCVILIVGGNAARFYFGF